MRKIAQAMQSDTLVIFGDQPGQVGHRLAEVPVSYILELLENAKPTQTKTGTANYVATSRESASNG